MDGELFLGIRLMQVLIVFRLRLKSMDLLLLLALQLVQWSRRDKLLIGEFSLNHLLLFKLMMLELLL